MIPAQTVFGRRRFGNAPTPETRTVIGGSPATAFPTARHTADRSRSSTSPRNSSVTWRLCGSTHFTAAPDLASDACSDPAADRMASPISTAMNVRTRGMAVLAAGDVGCCMPVR